MEVIISKRHPINFYLFLAIGLAFTLGLLGTFASLINRELQKDEIESKYVLLIVFLVSWTALLISIFIQYFRKTPKIIIDSQKITFDKKVYLISDVKEIIFQDKYEFVLMYNYDCVTIVFNNGEIKRIFYNMYNNTAIMCRKLDYLVYKKERSVVQKEVNVSQEHFYYYTDHFILSFRGIVFILFFLFFVFLYARDLNSQPKKTFLLILFLGLFFLCFRWQFSFFGINESYLVVRSQLKIFKKEYYRLEDIQHITFESQHRLPNRMKILFTDYTVKNFSAAALNDKTWKELQIELEKHNIKVRNEII